MRSLTNVSLVFILYDLWPKPGVVSEKLIVNRLLSELCICVFCFDYLKSKITFNN